MGCLDLEGWGAKVSGGREGGWQEIWKAAVEVGLGRVGHGRGSDKWVVGNGVDGGGRGEQQVGGDAGGGGW